MYTKVQPYLQRETIHYANIIPRVEWPFYFSGMLFNLLFYVVLWLNKINCGFLLIVSLIHVLFYSVAWMHEMNVESTYMGQYTRKVRSAFFFGFLLFLLSEVMVFSGFFWTFFDRVFNGAEVIGGLTLYGHIEYPILMFSYTFLGTFTLWLSGWYVNFMYKLIIAGNWQLSTFFGLLAQILGISFLLIQRDEYLSSKFCINTESIYSSFFILTGFHGFHVFVGLTLLNMNQIRHYKFNYTNGKHLGFNIAMVYYHFVDVVWIILFLVVYPFISESLVSTDVLLGGDVHTKVLNTFNF